MDLSIAHLALFALLSFVPFMLSRTCSVSHGVGSGEATTSEVVIWSRTDCNGAFMYVYVRPTTGEKSTRHRSRMRTSENSDYSMSLTVTGLLPYTHYTYNVAFSRLRAPPSKGFETGTFRTAADASISKPLKIVWTGDLAGQNVCRSKREGFPLTSAMTAERADVLVLSGDMIYADNLCLAVGLYGNEQIVGDFNVSANMWDFRAHWKYNREDHGYLELLAGSQVLVGIDDHEAVNDVGPKHDTRPNRAAGDSAPQPPYRPDVPLLPMAVRAMYEWNPFRATVAQPRHYGAFRYGKHVEIFRIDTRQYRDANLRNDSKYFPKSMLGIEQRMWLERAIEHSNATWKIIQSSVPISIPTGSIQYGRDGWTSGDPAADGPNTATRGGFERELLRIVESFRKSNSRNVLFLTADVHFASIFEYPAFGVANFWEGVVGPMNAGHFLKEEYNKELGGAQRKFLYGLKFDQSKILGWDKVKEYFNYGVVEVDSEGVLSLSIKNFAGVLYKKELRPVT